MGSEMCIRDSDDVIYDATAMGTGSDGSALRFEDRKDVHKRIVHETPKLKCNANISGVGTYMNLMEMEGVEAVIGPSLPNRKQQIRDDNINFLQRELGTTSYTSIHTPNYKVDLFEGETTGSTTKFLTSMNTQALQIPQINIDVAYEYRIVHASLVTEMGGYTTEAGEYKSEEFADGKVFVVKEANPIIRIREDSSFDEKDNYDIMVYSNK